MFILLISIFCGAPGNLLGQPIRFKKLDWPLVGEKLKNSITIKLQTVL